MAEISHKFLETAPQLVNFSFTDFATGRGIVDFYLGSTYNEAVYNRLSTTPFYSDKIFYKSVSMNVGNYTEGLDVDFDTEFLRTVIIEGTAIFNIPIAVGSGTNGLDPSWFALVYVYKVSGGAETQLVLSAGSVFTQPSLDANNDAIALSTINAVIPKTPFKVGDTLRISVRVWGKWGETAGNFQLLLGADPKGRQVNSVENHEEWTVAGGTAGREIDFTTIAQGAAITIATAQIPFRTIT